jgi:hypothetical protein
MVRNGLFICCILFFSKISFGEDFDTAIANHSQLRNLKQINARIIVTEDNDRIIFSIASKINVKYNAQCSKWEIGPLDTFKFINGAEYPGFLGCDNIISDLKSEAASISHLAVKDFMKYSLISESDSTGNHGRYKVVIKSDTFYFKSPKEAENFELPAYKFSIYSIYYSDHDNYNQYEIQDGEYPLHISFDLRACNYGKVVDGDSNSDNTECKTEYFDETWYGHVEKDIVLVKKGGSLTVKQLK